MIKISKYEKGLACVTQKKNAHRALGECPKRNKTHGISRSGMEYNIKMGLSEGNGISLANSPGSCQRGNVFGIPLNTRNLTNRGTINC